MSTLGHAFADIACPRLWHGKAARSTYRPPNTEALAHSTQSLAPSAYLLRTDLKASSLPVLVPHLTRFSSSPGQQVAYMRISSWDWCQSNSISELVIRQNRRAPHRWVRRFGSVMRFGESTKGKAPKRGEGPDCCESR